MSQAKERSVTRERLIGMQVIDGEGYLLGTVKDISFAIGRVGILLCVEGKDGSIKEIPWEEVQAVGDFVILRQRPIQTAGAQETQPAQAPLCPTCNRPLTWISQYQRWYCYKCKKYA